MESPLLDGSPRETQEKLHWESQQWKSDLCFIEDEITFIDRLLNSYVFQPNTPNLFERLQDFLQRLAKVKEEKATLRKRISKHESDLGGMMECKDETGNKEYFRKHKVLKDRMRECNTNFQALKSEIFNYAGGILKKRKPIS
ncbi:DUF342 domain-containing protein [Poritiphilus flavus]|uniref:Uncharacterized protein n=1 Tax=Poritiphilus flavus TaxID=2697053 RepID=A0A6L9EBF5_9FLAO|nr:DUF342 domain-containing protein [Poritiphilus flavus]NAS11932.1 hypothetical protein [Poritiphilus flavus]